LDWDGVLERFMPELLRPRTTSNMAVSSKKSSRC
jgi:hypothetical protein